MEGHYFEVLLAPGNSVKTVEGNGGDLVKPRKSGKSYTVDWGFLKSILFLEFKALCCSSISSSKLSQR